MTNKEKLERIVDICTIALRYQDMSHKLLNIVADIINDNGLLTPEEVSLGINKGKLNAIKEYKKRTGKFLLDSKRDVEEYFSNNNLSFKKF